MRGIPLLYEEEECEKIIVRIFLRSRRKEKCPQARLRCGRPPSRAHGASWSARTPECAIDTVVEGLKRTVWDDASFRQVEDAVDKMPADSDEVVLRCMVHAVNTSESFQAAEVADHAGEQARVCVCVGHAVEQVFMRRCLCFSCSSMPCSFHST